jgi:hypothetical protein
MPPPKPRHLRKNSYAQAKHSLSELAAARAKESIFNHGDIRRHVGADFFGSSITSR